MRYTSELKLTSLSNFVKMKLDNLLNAYNLTNYAVTDTEVRLRVGVGKIIGLERTGEFDGNDRTWYEFRGIKYSRPIERFDYPVYNDPVYWQGDYDGTKLGFRKFQKDD